MDNERSSVDHPDNAMYVVDIQALALDLQCSQQHARNVIRRMSESRLLQQANGVSKWYTTKDAIQAYLSNRKPRGRKPIAIKIQPKKVYKIALNEDYVGIVNTFLYENDLPTLVPARSK